MRESLRLGRIAGIPLGASWSFFAVTAFIALALAGGVLPAGAPGASETSYILAGVIVSVAFMAGVLLHEVSHALVARAAGIKVDGITLWLLGGLTRLDGDPATPGVEARVSGVGPAVSLAAGLVLMGIGWLGNASGWPALVVTGITWLGVVNAGLAVLNALPAAPLDGGRLLHALVWRLTGDPAKASRVAATAGTGLGWLLGAAGIALVVLGNLEGLWVAATGWFIVMGAKAEAGQALGEEMLGGRRVSDVMVRLAEPLPAWRTVGSLVEEGSVPPDPRAVIPVEAWSGDLAGFTTAADLQATALRGGGFRRVTDIAWPIDALATAAPDEPAISLRRRLAGVPAAIVLSEGRPVGVVVSRDLAALIGA